ncbi:MAG: rod shape-determining protein RodA [Actinobacteria bacterium]|nr:MAG: rod shape-determining protein RodA [Actinomycetota bacterium]
MQQSKTYRRIDYSLIISVLLLSAYGLLLIYGATYNKGLDNFRTQAIWWTLGLILMAFAAIYSYSQLKHYIVIMYVANIILLLAVLFTGSSSLGAQRWIQIGFFRLQPSEFCKLAMILVLASFLSDKKGILTGKDILKVFGLALPPVLIIFRQPDLGTALVVVFITVTMLLIAGMKMKHFLVICLIGLMGIFVVFNFNVLKPYQKNRLLVFVNSDLDPQGSGYNLKQSKIAVGSGGLLGKGLLSGTQTNLSFVPEAHTDFIFAVLGEKLGFFGASVLLVLYFILLTRAMRISLMADNFFGSLTAMAIVFMWLFQITVNIGMTIGIMPVTGIPLPFISYGGSALFTNLISCGLLLSIHARAIK